LETSDGDCSVQEMMWRSGLLFVLLSAAVWSAVCGLQCYQCESFTTPSCMHAGNTDKWSTCQDDMCLTGVGFGRRGNRMMCQPTGCANKKQSLENPLYLWNCSRFFHQIYAVYRGGFRPCIQQIAFKYLV